MLHQLYVFSVSLTAFSFSWKSATLTKSWPSEASSGYVLQLKHCTTKHLKVPGAVNTTGNLSHWEHTAVSYASHTINIFFTRLGYSNQPNGWECFPSYCRTLANCEESLGLGAHTAEAGGGMVSLWPPKTSAWTLFKMHIPFLNAGMKNF